MSAQSELIAKLQEIFQTDRADLDFGIYRILNTRRDEINGYLKNTLPKQIKEALAGNDVQENAVYNHLLTFFSRYYEAGDFISQRRYKGNTYAIPYNGEEVLLHWANKDQYYTKSGENFSNYRFTLADGRQVFFKLVAADTAKDNQKDNEKSRLFVLAAARAAEYDDEGEEIRAAVAPVSASADGQTLTICFEYKTLPKSEKQKAHSEAAIATIREHSAVQADWAVLFELAPTEKDPKRTVLEKHLNDYTTKNSADYFIHKDLGGFLKRELDFYIKNEVMDLDNIQQEGSIETLSGSLKQIQTLRAIAQKIIAFLAQLENFQKKLWLKKKFVVGHHYLITLDRIPETFHREIFVNPKQQAAWENLFSINKLEYCGGGVNLAESEACKHLVVDTSLFPHEFQTRLLSALSDSQSLDNATDGILIHSDNFQALNLLQARYREQVKCIYIDPPYNTEKDRAEGKFVYKDSYPHSTWITLIQNRLDISLPLLNQEAVFFTSLDETELHNAVSIIQNTNLKYHGVFTWRRTRTGGHLSQSFNQINDFVVTATTENKMRLFGGQADPEESQPLTKATNREKSLIFPAGSITFLDKENGILLANTKGTGTSPITVLTITEIKNFKNLSEIEILGNFVWSQSTLDTELQEGSKIIFKKFNNLNPRFLRQPKTHKPFPSLADNDFIVGTNEDGSDLVKELFGYMPDTSYPKPIELIKKLVNTKSFFDKNLIVLDYFAGSGTTAHAVINLNREDGGQRKYILVEQGEYFDTVLKPRVQKVIYSRDWKDGKPVADKDSGSLNGVSQMVKVLKLESYEDTLNNLVLQNKGELFGRLPESARQDYLLHYMLDLESRDSLLNTDVFKKPFDYRLNIATDSAGAYVATGVDLVETFNYLLGLRVQGMKDKRFSDGYVLVEGWVKNPSEKILVVWRDGDIWGYDKLPELLKKKSINPQDSEFDVVYINGDHTLPTAWQSDDGAESRTLKIVQIEAEFLRLMFGEA